MPGLHQLKPAKNSKKNRKRIGRGNASGTGTYSGRGLKGQKQRGSVPFLFEGGQLPLIKRLPHMRGFNNIFRVESTPVNLGSLEGFRAGSNIDPEKLFEAGLISKKSDRVKFSVTASSRRNSTSQLMHSASRQKRRLRPLADLPPYSVQLPMRQPSNL
jgi:large subunit ribosomal protein L15